MHIIGTIITDKKHLTELEKMFDEAWDIWHSCYDRDVQRKNEVFTLVYDAFQVPNSQRYLLDGKRHGCGYVWRLFSASRHAIQIKEQRLDVGVEVSFGSRKRHSARIIGYTPANDLRVELLDSPELQQRIRILPPIEVQRKDPVAVRIIPSSREIFERTFLSQLAGA